MKKLFKTFVAVALIGSLATFSSCTKTCDAGYEGTKCDIETRSKYTGQYSLSGSDNDGGTYTNLVTQVTTSSTGVQNMNITIGTIAFQIKLNDDGSSFSITGSSVSGYTYTGTGSFTSNSMSLVNLTETKTSTGDVLVYNLSGAKQ